MWLVVRKRETDSPSTPCGWHVADMLVMRGCHLHAPLGLPEKGDNQWHPSEGEDAQMLPVIRSFLRSGRWRLLGT